MYQEVTVRNQKKNTNVFPFKDIEKGFFYLRLTDFMSAVLKWNYNVTPD